MPHRLCSERVRRIKRYTVVKPSVWMFKTEDLCSEVSDELLFGTTLEILSENDTTAFCKTDYGYCGYINKWELYECVREDCDIGEKRILYGRCDVLLEPRYFFAPYMSLSKGSKVKLLGKYDERFSACEIGNKAMYLPNFAVEKNSGMRLGVNIAEAALSYIGVPYRWGGKSDVGIDCSGLVFMSALLCGAEIFRDSIPDKRYVDIIEETQVEAGDIAYFEGHTAVMLSRNSFVHSSAKRGRVVKEFFSNTSLSEKDVVCYARIKGKNGNF